jgi:crossover junction endodeoxyribonuclease RuvC
VKRVAAGFDPGIGASGLGAIARDGQRFALEHIETIRTDPADPLQDRVCEIFDKVGAVLRRLNPVCLAIENQLRVAAAARGRQGAAMAAMRAGRPPPKQLGFNASNDQTLVVMGAAMGAARAYGIPIVMLEPQEGKTAVLGPGHSNAEKEHVRAALERLFPEQRRASLNGWDAVSLAIGGEQKTQLLFAQPARPGRVGGERI